MVIDAVIEPDDLRAELIRRFALAEDQGPRLLRAAQPDHAGVTRGERPSTAAEEGPAWSATAALWDEHWARLADPAREVVLEQAARRARRPGSSTWAAAPASSAAWRPIAGRR